MLVTMKRARALWNVPVSGKGSDSQLIRHPFFNYSRRLRGDCASTNVPFQRTARVRKQLLVHRAMR